MVFLASAACYAAGRVGQWGKGERRKGERRRVRRWFITAIFALALVREIKETQPLRAAGVALSLGFAAGRRCGDAKGGGVADENGSNIVENPDTTAIYCRAQRSKKGGKTFDNQREGGGGKRGINCAGFTCTCHSRRQRREGEKGKKGGRTTEPVWNSLFVLMSPYKFWRIQGRKGSKKGREKGVGALLLFPPFLILAARAKDEKEKEKGGCLSCGWLSVSSALPCAYELYSSPALVMDRGWGGEKRVIFSRTVRVSRRASRVSAWGSAGGGEEDAPGRKSQVTYCPIETAGAMVRSRGEEKEETNTGKTRAVDRLITLF